MIEKVTVFSNGDSRAVSTWSNVPYFFTETLIAKGIEVRRVDLIESPRLKQVFNKTIMRLVRRMKPASSYGYFRSSIHFRDVRRRIKRALAEYSDSDANFFLTFSFSGAGLSRKPTLLFCDWTYEYYLKHFLGREPDLFERYSIRRENQQIESADSVVSLFPAVTGYMQSRYKNEKIRYFGNVVNALRKPDKARIMQEKAHSMDILFIGSGKYMEGAKSLIAAHSIIKSDYPNLLLHIVGIQESDFSDLPAGVKCYGYLDKAHSGQKDQYYSLLGKAKVFVNTTSKWGAFSAMLEAMFFYVPVITTPYKECVATFGEHIRFGCYCEDGSTETLCSKLRFVFQSEFYEELCDNAHQAVKDFSWDNYIDKVLGEIAECSSARSPK